MAITRLTGGLTPADGGDPRTFPAIWNDAATQIETAQTDIDAVEADVLEAQTDISTLQGSVATAQGDITTLQTDLNTLEASAVTLASGTPVDGNSIVYDTASGGWIPGAGGGGGASVTISTTAPASPSDGDMWWNSDTGSLYLYYTDADSSQWVPADGPQMIVSDTAPSGYQGQLWFDSSQGQMFLYYDDGDSAQWVSANGPQVMVSEVQPAGYQGQLWFDSTTGLTYIYYDDGTTAQWVSAIGGSLAGNIIQVVHGYNAATVSTTSSSYVDTGLTATITPTSTSSKIIAIAQAADFTSTNSAGASKLEVVRGTAASYVQFNCLASQYTSTNFSLVTSTSVMGYDTPATTSAVTYSLVMRSESASNTAYIGNQQNLILMEVAG